MMIPSRYQAYRYPTSAADHRPMVAALALTLLFMAIATLAYLTYAAYTNRAIMAESQSTSIMHAPTFINTSLLR